MGFGDIIRKLLWRGLGPPLAAALGGLRVEGREHVPATGPVLLLPNHLSDVDPVALGIALPRVAWYMAKSDLFEIRVLGPFLRFMRAFSVRQGFADRAAIRQAEALLAQGEALVLFPEGHLSETGRMEPFQPGAALIALRSGATVIPVGILNTPAMLPYGELTPRRAPRPVTVRFGAPLRLDDLASWPRRDALEEATRRIEAAVAALAEQPIPPREGEAVAGRERGDVEEPAHAEGTGRP